MWQILSYSITPNRRVSRRMAPRARHDDWTIFLGNTATPRVLQRNPRVAPTRSGKGASWLGCFANGAPRSPLRGRRTHRISTSSRVTDSHAAQARQLGDGRESSQTHGRRQRVRAAVQTGLATGTAFAGAVHAQNISGLQFGQLDLTEIDLSHSNWLEQSSAARSVPISDAKQAVLGRTASMQGRGLFPHTALGALFHGADSNSLHRRRAVLRRFQLSRLVRADLKTPTCAA